MLKLNIQLFGGRGGSGGMSTGKNGAGGKQSKYKLRAMTDEEKYLFEYESDRKGLDALMAKDVRKYESFETSSGQIIEKQPMKDMVRGLKEVKENGYCDDDWSIAIEYNDGSHKVYTGGDDTSKMRVTGIHNVVWENENTTATAGKDIGFHDASPEWREWERKRKSFVDWTTDWRPYSKNGTW